MKLLLIGLGVLLAACAPVAPPTPTNAPARAASTVTPPTLLPEEPVPFSTSGWRTDFKKHIVPYQEILSGGPPKDGIPALDDPKFVSAREARAWLKENEPVIFFEHQGDARAYPLQILMWHEIVNDTVGDLPVLVTFCPLCNASIVFERTVAGAPTTFGTTGKLHYSDLVMYDRATESWWQQMTGEAIVGERVGTHLKFLFSQMIAFGDFEARYPTGKVLSRETGYTRNYGANPYVGYDAPSNLPFLYAGPPAPPKLTPSARVVTLALGDAASAYPYAILQERRVINDLVAGVPIAVFWKSGTASALDRSSIASGRDVGATGVFRRELDARILTFRADADQIRDLETQSAWNILGQATEGALKGRQLTPLVHGNFFWFAWAAFRPDSKLYE
ncbi:MAG: DUF3179 domain-containing protein [Chloroflexi bacterium]|nr:DUF3179 domain-containing protein [Chloroflexota bacterium]